MQHRFLDPADFMGQRGSRSHHGAAPGAAGQLSPEQIENEFHRTANGDVLPALQEKLELFVHTANQILKDDRRLTFETGRVRQAPHDTHTHVQTLAVKSPKTDTGQHIFSIDLSSSYRTRMGGARSQAGITVRQERLYYEGKDLRVANLGEHVLRGKGHTGGAYVDQRNVVLPSGPDESRDGIVEKARELFENWLDGQNHAAAVILHHRLKAAVTPV